MDWSKSSVVVLATPRLDPLCVRVSSKQRELSKRQVGRQLSWVGYRGPGARVDHNSGSGGARERQQGRKWYIEPGQID